MAILFYLGQVPAQWFTEAGDGVLSGGVLRFYEVGTSSPKAVYSDYQGVTAAGTSVTLDTSGRANVFLSGLYSVTLEDSDGVQIGPKVDGIGDGSSIGIFTPTIVTNYDSLRAIDGNEYRAAMVEGRISNGDYGQGLFIWDSLSTDPDDGGTILKPTSNPTAGRWRRVIDDTIDPRWYGVAMDGTTANDSTFAVAVAASVSMKSRLHFEGGYCRLASNATVSANARISCAMRSGITSTSAPVTLSFASGSRFEGGSPECFSGQLQPSFAFGTTCEIPLSWMGAANAEARLDKWAAADAGVKFLALDLSVSSSSLPTFAATSKLVPRGGVISVTGTAQNISVDVEHDSYLQIIAWANKSAVGTVYVGRRPCRPEWFGAVGDNTVDDTVPLYAAAKTGDIQAGYNKSYRATTAIATTPLTVRGDTTAPLTKAAFASVSDVDNPRIFLDPATAIDMIDLATAGRVAFIGAGLAMSSNAVVDTNGGIFAMIGGQLFASAGSIKSASVDLQESVIPDEDIFTATVDNQHYTDVLDFSDPTKRKSRNDSSFQDVYLENEKKTTDYTKHLQVDADGKVIASESLGQVGDTSVIGNLHVGGDFTQNFSRTLIEFTATNVFRNGLDLGAGTYYDVQTTDKPVIAVKNSSGAVRQIRPAALPSGSYIMHVVATDVGAQRIDVGDIAGSAFCWLATMVKLPDTTLTNGKMVTIGYQVNGKWSFS